MGICQGTPLEDEADKSADEFALSEGGDADQSTDGSKPTIVETGLRKLLADLMVNSIIQSKQQIFEISSTTPAAEAFEQILAIKPPVWSCPVWDDLESKYVGFLDLMDLVPYVLQQHKSGDKAFGLTAAVGLAVEDLMDAFGQGPDPAPSEQGQWVLVLFTHWRVGHTR